MPQLDQQWVMRRMDHTMLEEMGSSSKRSCPLHRARGLLASNLLVLGSRAAAAWLHGQILKTCQVTITMKKDSLASCAWLHLTSGRLARTTTIAHGKHNHRTGDNSKEDNMGCNNSKEEDNMGCNNSKEE